MATHFIIPEDLEQLLTLINSLQANQLHPLEGVRKKRALEMGKSQ